MDKIGVGIITCNRNEFLKNLIESMQNNCIYNEMVIVNDGNKKINDNNIYIINNTQNLGVCKTKNIAFNYLLNKDCDYIFLIEDDMLIKKDPFKAYINAYKRTNIHHFCFAYHGPANKNNISKGLPKPRKIIDYGDIKISLNKHCVGSFCFYTKQSLLDVGLMDENFDKNNFEHVEHSYRLAKAGYSTPYWWWSDLANSLEYIDEQACSEENSSIHRGDSWQQRIFESAKLFEHKHNYMPAWNNSVPDTSFERVKKFLKEKINEN